MDYLTCYNGAVCLASTNCWTAPINATDWQDFVNETNKYYNIYETNVTIDSEKNVFLCFQ
jgi:hypothetical protein